ncbi:MAG TPA: phosphoribosylaminoimidazolesuccinocarboxamide synthase [Mycobacteriales bacterium]|jgi:phosphoribosylaminoimidazole-succinocarboxamide synthase|nr:phosphoribosylaminoimidazolesuccinocarboxamide synthase [Mycobacteriales bacterium]
MAGLSGLDELRVHAGKVRDLYAAGDGLLLMVASDRMSAFDVVMPTAIPDKGAVLTGLSLWWFEQLADVVPNHVVTAKVEDYPAVFAPFADQLRGRSVLCRRLEMVSVECVARGYLAGSGLRDYNENGSVCGVSLPSGLRDGSRLPEPIFTPTTKAPVGEHDTAMTFDEVVAAVGAEQAESLRSVTLDIYRRGLDLAGEAGIILADTKVELGLDRDGNLVLGDEVLTPDSSRFWPAITWAPGGAQQSFDKQYLRDWLTDDSGWDRSSPPPDLPDDVVARTREKYVDAYERLTGRSFTSYLSGA